MESKAGSGRTFRDQSLTDGALWPKIVGDKAFNSAEKGEQKILVTDDDKDVLALTARTFESAGYQIL